MSISVVEHLNGSRLIALARHKETTELLSRPTEGRSLGEHPETGRELLARDGRYGPYVTDGTTNASIPKGSSPEALTFEQAMELLEARRNAAPSSRRAGGRRRTVAAVPARQIDAVAGRAEGQLP